MTRSSAIVVAMLVLCACTAQSPAASIVVEEQSPAAGVEGKLAQAVGIETLGSVFTPLLQAGCALPCSISQVFSTAEDNQPHIDIRPFRGKCRLVAECHSLGSFRISGFSSMPRGEVAVTVTLRAEPGRITLSAEEAGSNYALSVSRVAL